MPDRSRTASPRRDALRNRELLVNAARQAFASDGLDASMDAIAKAAGVGVGTLYRHFPTKEDLVAAVINLDKPQLEAQRDRIRRADLDPVAALEQWLDVLVRKMTAYDGLPGPLRAAVDATGTPLGSTCHTIVDATETFLAPARDAGLAKPQLTGRALFLAALGIAWASSAADDTETREQLTATLRSGWAAEPPPA
ncbi:TetR/AcrR family transcriptional regulator [Propionibacterium australiense]|nr:TetR/AcrR family transcriptional regulator [Propionibacterium australiense]SYZ33579.1 Homeobox domain-like [Propionibacterium australiense]VEH89534.1 DNA-binding transcriptional regulator EnvR [Propionibacterium australiense]